MNCLRRRHPARQCRKQRGWRADSLDRPVHIGDKPLMDMAQAAPRVALLYPGDHAARLRSDPGESRFAALFQALAAAGVRAEPAIYNDDFADEVQAQLQAVDAVLVWCNPIESGRRRDRLDGLLRQLSDAGVFVSSHPDTILRLGTKDVLVQTRGLPFGSDAHRIDSELQLRAELPTRLLAGARVLKQVRGHSGIGVWRVERAGPQSPLLRVQHAQRGALEEVVEWSGLLQRLAPYFEPEQGGHMVDQAWQPRLDQGMLRAYLVGDRVAGFGHQAVNALYPAAPGQPAPSPGPRLYHGSEHPDFQLLRQRLEGGWIEALCEAVALPRDRLPLLWDCDFLFGEALANGATRHVLCEINVSSVSPFPASAILPLVQGLKARLALRSR